MNYSYHQEKADTISAILIANELGDAKRLYRQAWHLRRLMSANSSDISFDRAYADLFYKIFDSGPLGRRIANQIMREAYTERTS